MEELPSIEPSWLYFDKLVAGDRVWVMLYGERINGDVFPVEDDTYPFPGEFTGARYVNDSGNMCIQIIPDYPLPRVGKYPTGATREVSDTTHWDLDGVCYRTTLLPVEISHDARLVRLSPDDRPIVLR